MMISATAIGFIHLYFDAVVPRADLELVAVAPAQADRDRERQVEPDHRDRGDGVERQRHRRAVDVDLDQRRQGQERAARRRPAMTALAGTRLAVSFDQCSEPGMAPSRLNAKVIREAEVMHDVAQKNCADAEMNSTNVAQFVPSDADEDRRPRPRRPARCPAGRRRRSGSRTPRTAAGRSRRAPSRRSSARCPWPPPWTPTAVSSDRWARGVEAGDRVLRQQEAERHDREPEREACSCCRRRSRSC